MTKSRVQIGALAPEFRLKAIGSGREVSLAASKGMALLLAFHDQNTVDIVQQMQEAVRANYPDARQLLVASIVNMSVVPVFLRPLAETVMKGSYTKAAAAMPEGLDAADYVVILTDWDGVVSRAYGATRVDKKGLIVLIDGEGAVRGHHQSAQLDRAALEMLQGVLG